jgi:hypothetical protein
MGEIERASEWPERRRAVGFGVVGGVAVAVVALAAVAIVNSWSPEAWAAAAAWVTAIVALAAGAIALGQLGEARRLRREQAQPYVVVFMESSPVEDRLIELVIKNFGTTAAHDVRVQIDPPPKRAVTEDFPNVWLPELIPVLAPGQEWRTLWDSTVEHKSGFPERHEAVVTFTDSQGRALEPLRSVLDWGAYKERMQVTLYSTHHAAKALRGIEKNTKGWQESMHGGLAVYVRDGDAKDERQREWAERRRAELQSEAEESAPEGAE